MNDLFSILGNTLSREQDTELTRLKVTGKTKQGTGRNQRDKSFLLLILVLILPWSAAGETGAFTFSFTECNLTRITSDSDGSVIASIDINGGYLACSFTINEVIPVFYQCTIMASSLCFINCSGIEEVSLVTSIRNVTVSRTVKRGEKGMLERSFTGIEELVAVIDSTGTLANSNGERPSGGNFYTVTVDVSITPSSGGASGSVKILSCRLETFDPPLLQEYGKQMRVISWPVKNEYRDIPAGINSGVRIVTDLFFSTVEQIEQNTVITLEFNGVITADSPLNGVETRVYHQHELLATTDDLSSIDFTVDGTSNSCHFRVERDHFFRSIVNLFDAVIELEITASVDIPDSTASFPSRWADPLAFWVSLVMAVGPPGWLTAVNKGLVKKGKKKGKHEQRGGA